ncbi:MAG: glycosyl transferase, partial [Acidocella sp.]|nr:glycosyl transferase [Acidocella sp.]
GPWLAVAMAALLFTPVLYWNATHGWASFHYQGGRATGLRLRPFMPFSIWGGEALFLLPWLWLPMMGLMLGAFRHGPAERRGWLLAWASVIPVTLFAIIGLWSSTHILYHWATPGYLMLFPLLGNWAQGFAPRLRNAVAAASAALLAGAALFIAAETSFAIVPALDTAFHPGKSPMLQAVDWTSITPQIPPGVDAIAAQRWFDAGKIGYALLRANKTIPVTVFGPEPHEFAFSTPLASLIGKTVLVLGNAAAFSPYFKALTPGPALTV